MYNPYFSYFLMGAMQFGPPGPFGRFQYGYEPDQHFLAFNQCWKVMLNMQSQNFDPKVHFCPKNQHVYERADLSYTHCNTECFMYIYL